MEIPENHGIKIDFLVTDYDDHYSNIFFKTYEGASKYIINFFKHDSFINDNICWINDSCYSDKSCKEKLSKLTIDMAAEKFSPKNLKALNLIKDGDYKIIYSIWDASISSHILSIYISLVRVFHD